MQQIQNFISYAEKFISLKFATYELVTFLRKCQQLPDSAMKFYFQLKETV